VIAADLDGESGTALRRLTGLHPGDRVELDLTDGSTLTFQVSSAGAYAADRLPPDLFRRGGRARLSLVASTSSPAPPEAGPARIVVEATLRAS
jgi:hypothetical protein